MSMMPIGGRITTPEKSVTSINTHLRTPKNPKRIPQSTDRARALRALTMQLAAAAQTPTRTLSQRKGPAPQPSITWGGGSQPGGGLLHTNDNNDTDVTP